MNLFVEQLFNALQLGMTLFLLASGLTLVFGIMNVINLAHGSLYMIGAFAMAAALAHGAPFVVAIAFGAAAAGVAGAAIELGVIRRLYARDELAQVLATFGLILFLNELAAIVFGRAPLFVALPPALSGSLALGAVPYSFYRLLVIALGLAVAAGIWFLIARTRIGMLIRAGATHRDLVDALGIDIARLYTFVFALGALLAGLAGAAVAPIFSVTVGMGEQILITTFVVVVVGGLGSVRGAFVAALLVAAIDTFGRAYVPIALQHVFSAETADSLGSGLSSIAVYVFMAAVLVWKPRGLFPFATR